MFVGILTLFLAQYCRQKRVRDVGEESMQLLPPSLPVLDGFGEGGEGAGIDDTHHSTEIGTVYRMDGGGGGVGGRGGRGRGRGRSVGRALPGGGEGRTGGNSGGSGSGSGGGSSWSGMSWGGSGIGIGSSVAGGVIGSRSRRIAPTMLAQDSPDPNPHPDPGPHPSPSPGASTPTTRRFGLGLNTGLGSGLGLSTGSGLGLGSGWKNTATAVPSSSPPSDIEMVDEGVVSITYNPLGPPTVLSTPR